MGNTCNTCNCDGKGEATPNEFTIQDQAWMAKSQNHQAQNAAIGGEHRRSLYDLGGNQQNGNNQRRGTDKGNSQNQSNSMGSRINSKPDITDEYLKKNIRKIIKIQAAYRGFKARRLTSMLRSKHIGSSKYFTYEESKETVSKKRYDPNQQRERRPPYTFKTGAVYTGQWKGGFRDGEGEQRWPDGAMYIGEWRENRAHGRGKFIHVDGDIYDGFWANDKANGHGIYKHVNGAQYEGEWKDDLQHGRGIETWTDGSRYEGNYSQGRKDGIGTYQWNDQSQYTGDWVENKISGIGIYSWLDGRNYEGEWKNNNMEGMGIYIWNDGRKYEGEYKDDKKHGFGVYTWADGRCYEGYWWKGKQHGIGTYVVPKEDKVKYGLWEDGKRIEWFSETDVQMINQRKKDYTEYFKQADSAEMVAQNASFRRPPRFDDKLSEIKIKIAKLRSATSGYSGFTKQSAIGSTREGY
ncbi:UNKNOWN [Stylonychia lemnae]|uniref:Morn repeat protein n=1 Tax=Stylonychia lemnae TaxID=5949 RepID=A0A077ZN48_STYLE|nr:UNKNOWN [Stylonychia lemnae]|eukprot:CDW71402.1 UNKNOWN [Stylonychia lemnae]